MSEPRTIIVTGASSGIGAYCARALKRDGWRVFATARKPAGHRTRSTPTASRRSISTIASRNRSRRWWRRCWSGPAARSTRSTTMARIRRPAPSRTCRSRPARAVRGQSVRLARSHPPHRAGDAPAGSWPHRQLLVDPRADAGPLARRLCRIQACAGRADDDHADRSSRSSGIHVCLIEPGPVESQDRHQRPRLVRAQHRS